LIGEITKTEPRYGHTKGWTATQVIRDYFTRIDRPVIYDFPCGHGREKITIPIGVKVVLDATEKTLDFKEAGVV
jgi:muramoyltetrapeptide carboxypeptidase LdcA involved in peptidoglycan recycling